MRTIAVQNQKGGTAKTTTAVNLAAGFGALGVRVLLLDLDGQGCATVSCGIREDGAELFELLSGKKGSMATLVRPTPIPGVEIVPSSQALGGLERATASVPSPDSILRGLLRKLPQDQWDLVVLDCPPALGLLSVSALVACDEVVVPIDARFLGLGGAARIVETVRELVDRELNSRLRVGAVIPCRVDDRLILCRECVRDMRLAFGTVVTKRVIRENVSVSEAPSHGLPVRLYAPKSSGADDYDAVALELAERWRMRHSPAARTSRRQKRGSRERSADR